MLVRGVVADKLRDDPQPECVGGPDEGAEVRQRPVRGMDVRVVRDVVAVVTQRRGVEGQQPDRRDPKIAQVVELLDEAAKVAGAVPGGVPEGPEVDLVDDRVAIPEGILAGTGLRCPGAATKPGNRCLASGCCAAGPRLTGRGVARYRRGHAGQGTGQRSLALRVSHRIASYSSATEAAAVCAPGRQARRSHHASTLRGRPVDRCHTGCTTSGPRVGPGSRRVRGGSSRGTCAASRPPGGSSAPPGPGRSGSARRRARTPRPSHSARRSTSGSGTYMSRPAPIDEPRHVRQRGPVHRHAGQHLPARAPGLERLLAQHVLDPEDVREREVAVLADELLGQRLPAELGPAVGVRDVAHDVRARGLAQLLRRLGRDEHVGGHGSALDRLEHQEAAQAVADGHRRRAQPLEGRDHVLRVRLDVEGGRVGRLGPVVVAQVEGVALPAAAREVVQVALPDPGAAQLAVDEQERLPARAPLGQPGFDVEAPLRRARSRPCGRAGRRSRCGRGGGRRRRCRSWDPSVAPTTRAG